MAKTPFKYLPIAGILILLCIIGYFFIATGYRGDNNSGQNKALPEEGLTVENPHCSQEDTEKGTRFELDADKGTYSQDKQRVKLDNFRLKIKPLNGAAMEIKGEKADYDIGAKVIRLSGNLQGYGSDDYSIFAEELIFSYDEKDEGVLKTDEPVRVAGRFFSISGKGLVYNTEKEDLDLLSDVKTLIEKGR